MAEKKKGRKPFHFPKMEEDVLTRWKKHNVFQRSLTKPSPKGSFVFYEGPPTANGKPGIHHLETRVFKDLIPRYKTMQGYHVARKAGWDTHGLPVELEVEKSLGLKNKKDIEAYGIEQFNAKCKESVWTYKEEWERFTERVGYWVDMDDPYVTYDPAYVESVWWVIKQIWDKELLYKSHRVTPYCARCGTGLSSHEMAQGYKDVPEESVYVKFEVRNSKSETNSKFKTRNSKLYLLAWTTTPWTLPGNLGLAVHPDFEYVCVNGYAENAEGKMQKEKWVLEKNSWTRLGKKWGFLGLRGKPLLVRQPQGSEHPGEVGKVIWTKKGKELIGMRYEPLFDVNAFHESDKAYTVLAGDFVSTEEGTGIVHTAVMYGEDDYQLGVHETLPQHHTVGEDGKFTNDVPLVAGKWFKDAEEPIKKDLEKRGLLFKRENFTHSYPHCWRCDTPLIYYARESWYIAMTKIQKELMKNNDTINWVPAHLKEGRFGDWLREIKDWAFSRERYWGTPLPIWESADGDRICIGSFAELKKLAKDPKQVSDDFDPHRPFVDDVILENNGKEYTRVKDLIDVWFDSGAMPFAQGHYPGENKEWIEKNERYPADYICEAIDQTRGWFYTLLAVSTLLGKGASYKNVITLGHVNDAKGQKMSKSRGNTVDPWALIERYGADVLRWHFYTINQPGDPKNFDERQVQQVLQKHFLILQNVLSFYKLHSSEFRIQNSELRISHVLDRWILNEVHALVRDVTEHLDAYRILEAGRAIQEFTTDLSTWYVRRSRERFKDEKSRPVALVTLRETLLTLSKLLAPFTPFFAEHLYQELDGEGDSVHLASWPVAGTVTDVLQRDMQRIRDLVEVSHALRAQAEIKVRQPLSQLVVRGPKLEPQFVELARDELNVQEVVFSESPKIPSGASWAGDEERGVWLNTEMTDELVELGMVRELVRQINALRKDAGLTPGDQVALRFMTESEKLKKLFVHYAPQLQIGGGLTDIIEVDIKEPAAEVELTSGTVLLAIHQ